MLLLPKDPDASALRCERALQERFGAPSRWSSATASAAPGATAWSGWRSAPRACRRCSICAAGAISKAARFEVTQVGLADEIASAAQLLMGEADEGRPAVLVRGLAVAGAAAAGSGADPRAPRRTCSDERGGRVVAFRAGSAAPSWRSASTATLPADRLMVVCNTGDDFEHLGLRSRRTSTRCSTRSPASPTRTTGWGRVGRDLELHGGRSGSSAARPGSGSAMPTSRPTSSARVGSLPAKACRDQRGLRPAPRRRARGCSRCAISRCGRWSGPRAACCRSSATSSSSGVRQGSAGFEFRGAAAARPPAEVLAGARGARARGGGDLPFQSRSSASIRSSPCRACAPRSPHCRAPVVAVSPIIGGQCGQGADRQDDGGTRAGHHQPGRSRSITGVCSTGFVLDAADADEADDHRAGLPGRRGR